MNYTKWKAQKTQDEEEQQEREINLLYLEEMQNIGIEVF